MGVHCEGLDGPGWPTVPILMVLAERAPLVGFFAPATIAPDLTGHRAATRQKR